MTDNAQHTPVRRRVGAYFAAIQWIAANDDTEWLDDENGSASVTLCLVADVFGRTVNEAVGDLRSVMRRDREAQAGLEQARSYVRDVLAKGTGSQA